MAAGFPWPWQPGHLPAQAGSTRFRPSDRTCRTRIRTAAIDMPVSMLHVVANCRRLPMTSCSPHFIQHGLEALKAPALEISLHVVHDVRHFLLLVSSTRTFRDQPWSSSSPRRAALPNVSLNWSAIRPATTYCLPRRGFQPLHQRASFEVRQHLVQLVGDLLEFGQQILLRLTTASSSFCSAGVSPDDFFGAGSATVVMGSVSRAFELLLARFLRFVLLSAWSAAAMIRCRPPGTDDGGLGFVSLGLPAPDRPSAHLPGHGALLAFRLRHRHVALAPIPSTGRPRWACGWPKCPSRSAASRPICPSDRPRTRDCASPAAPVLRPSGTRPDSRRPLAALGRGLISRSAGAFRADRVPRGQASATARSCGATAFHLSRTSSDCRCHLLNCSVSQM